MLLFLFLGIWKIDCIFCLIENKTEDIFNEINSQRKQALQIHLTLQLAAHKRCGNEQELAKTYEKILEKTYQNDLWPKQEQLNKVFSNVIETIYFNGLNLRNDYSSNANEQNFLYIGIAENNYTKFSVRCILYGSINNHLLTNQQRLLRLIYILIACGIFLLCLISFSIFYDRKRIKLEQEQQEQQRISIAPKKSIVERMTLAQLGSIVDQRPSAIHSFIQSPK